MVGRLEMAFSIGVALAQLSQHISGMFLRFLACSAVVGFFLTGCVPSLEARDRHIAKASRVYTAGSSVAGNGQTLLLFPDGRWEQWMASCTETKLWGRGTYRISGKQITFLRKGEKPETLELFRYDGREYLGTCEEQRAIQKDPNEARMGFTLKRWK